MSRDAHWRPIASTAIAYVVVVVVVAGGAWLASARPHDAGAARAQSLPIAHFIAETPAPPDRTPLPAAPRPTTASVTLVESASLQHPLTAEHRALYRDGDLLTASWRALQAHDFTHAREVLAQHRAESARAYDDLNDGLTILADCMQYASADARDRAQRFYDEQTFSTARRRIRRYCLEAISPTTTAH